MKLPRTFYMNMRPPDIEDFVQQITKALSYRISFGRTNTNPPGTGAIWTDHRNIEHWKANGTTPGVANTEFSISHQLLYVPITFFGHTDNGGILYKGVTAWTAATPSAAGTIFLKCTTVSANYQILIL